jgi:predicted MFS family arabinose efflux permease
MLPVIAPEIFKTDASGLGLLFSAAGAGAVVGAVIVSAIGRYFNPHRLILGGGLLFATSLLVFTFQTSVAAALPCLFLVGLGKPFKTRRSRRVFNALPMSGFEDGSRASNRS